MVWRRKIGQGLSGPVVVGDRVILFHRVGDREMVESLDAATGTSSGGTAIRRPIATTSASTKGRARCRSSPSGVVYTFGAEGQLHAVDLAMGKRSGAGTRRGSSACRKASSAPPARRWSRAAGVIANIGGAKARHRRVRRAERQGRCGPRPTTTRAIRRRSARRSAARLRVFLTRGGLVGLDPGDRQVQFQRAWRARQMHRSMRRRRSSWAIRSSSRLSTGPVRACCGSTARS